MLPIALAVIGRIQGQSFTKSLTVLLDSGSTTSWVSKKCLPVGIQGYTVPTVTGATLAGTFTSSEQVCLQDMVLPEFHAKRVLPKMAAKVFHADCRYDMILGRDVLRAFGIVLDFKDDVIVSDGISKPMRVFPEVEGMTTVDVLLQEYLDEIDPAFNDEESFDSSDAGDVYGREDGFAEILESKYDQVTPEQIAEKCTRQSNIGTTERSRQVVFQVFYSLRWEAPEVYR